MTFSTLSLARHTHTHDSRKRNCMPPTLTTLITKIISHLSSSVKRADGWNN